MKKLLVLAAGLVAAGSLLGASNPYTCKIIGNRDGGGQLKIEYPNNLLDCRATGTHTAMCYKLDNNGNHATGAGSAASYNAMNCSCPEGKTLVLIAGLQDGWMFTSNCRCED